jgi:hypothetical protein
MSPTQGKTPIKKITAVEPVINKKTKKDSQHLRSPGLN